MTSDEQLNKLPKWAQIEFRDLQRQRDVAVRELNDWCNCQTPSQIYIDEAICTGEQRGPSTKRRYIQSTRVVFTLEGKSEIEVRIRNSSMLEFCGLSGTIQLSPRASNSVLVWESKL